MTYQKLHKFILPTLLVVIAVVTAWANYHPGTWLSGWDALHPEFNFPLNFKRLIFGVFREEQGLGAVSAQAHMADLPRVVILALFSLILPQNFVKYFFIAGTLITGVLGSYFFIKNVLGVEGKAAFLGALFYLFNLGTLQQYIVIQEMFAVHFAALPWLFLTASSYLLKSAKWSLALFALVSLLSTPQAHTPTLWYAYFLIFSAFLAFFVRKNVRKVVILLALTLAINSFWLLPNFYFVLSGHATQVQEAKINKIFSEEAFLHNQNFGNIGDLLIFKNFLFEWLIYTGSSLDSYDFLLNSWRGHLNNLGVLSLGYLFAVFVLLGIVLALKSKNIFAKALFLPILLAGVFILNNTPPLIALFSFLQDQLPLFKEALRFPFTKFSLLLIFFASCYFSLAQARLMDFLKKRGFLQVLQTGIVALSLVIYSWPVFQGEFISKYLQVKIPADYFQMFTWFNTQPDGRIAQLPVHSFWGWVYYDWGFQGAQFVSFGLKQPLLDRDFDRWNLSNEQAFRELSYAVYSQDRKLLDNVLKKYQVAYIILDKSVLAPGKQQDKKILFFNEIESLLLSKQEGIAKVKQFGKISVYQTNFGGSLFRAPKTFTQITLSGRVGEVDWVYRDVGDYVLADANAQAVRYPFISLSDNQNFLNITEGISLQDTISQGSLEDYLRRENVIPAELYARGNDLTLGGIPYRFPKNSGKNWLVNLDRETLSLKNPPSYGQLFLSTKTVNNLSFYSDEVKNWQKQEYQLAGSVEICGEKAPDQSSGFIAVDDQTFKIVTKNTSACVYLPLRQFVDQENLLNSRNLLRVSFQALFSSPKVGARFCFLDHLTQRCGGEKLVQGKESNVFYLPIIPADLDRWDLVFFADNPHNNLAEEVTFNQLEVAINGAKGFWTITPEEISQGNFGKITSNFQFPGSGHQVEDCAGNLQLPKSAVTAAAGYIEYNSLGGSSCGYFSFPSLPHNLGYLLSFEAKNIAGLPLRLCAANLFSKRCDVFSSLPKSSDFGENTILIPPMGDGGLGYDIHFNNYSIGSIPTINRLRNLKITPFPYYYLTQLNFKPEGKEVTTASSLNIKYIKEIWPQFYMVEVENPSSNPGLLVLDRAFESGWWASEGKQVLTNGWANGWLIEGGKKGKIFIFFWPQLLEFLGFTLLVIIIFLLIRKRWSLF